jgi:hypothetical protein
MASFEEAVEQHRALSLRHLDGFAHVARAGRARRSTISMARPPST